MKLPSAIKGNRFAGVHRRGSKRADKGAQDHDGEHATERLAGRTESVFEHGREGWQRSVHFRVQRSRPTRTGQGSGASKVHSPEPTWRVPPTAPPGGSSTRRRGVRRNDDAVMHVGTITLPLADDPAPDRVIARLYFRQVSDHRRADDDLLEAQPGRVAPDAGQAARTATR